MKQVNLKTRVYYSGTRYLPFLEHSKWGTFPLKENKGVQFFDGLPTLYAKKLVEGTPAMFSLSKEVMTSYDSYDLENLKKYATDRGLKFHPATGKDKLIAKLIAADKKEKPEEKADALKDENNI